MRFWRRSYSCPPKLLKSVHDRLEMFASVWQFTSYIVYNFEIRFVQNGYNVFSCSHKRFDQIEFTQGRGSTVPLPAPLDNNHF